MTDLYSGIRLINDQSLSQILCGIQEVLREWNTLCDVVGELRSKEHIKKSIHRDLLQKFFLSFRGDNTHLDQDGR